MLGGAGTQSQTLPHTPVMHFVWKLTRYTNYPPPQPKSDKIVQNGKHVTCSLWKAADKGKGKLQCIPTSHLHDRQRKMAAGKGIKGLSFLCPTARRPHIVQREWLRHERMPWKADTIKTCETSMIKGSSCISERSVMKITFVTLQSHLFNSLFEHLLFPHTNPHTFSHTLQLNPADDKDFLYMVSIATI